MAQFSLTIGRWRMLRVALKKKKARFEDLRNMARHDRDDLDWLIKIGYVTDLGDGLYSLTPAGVEASDMGYYEMDFPGRAPEPEPAPVSTPAPKKGKGRKKK